jgi:predicted DNA-binding antitoxin AbrB/MazE fold protein
MPLEIEATYENGVLKPDRPLPLQENQRVRLTVQETTRRARRGCGLLKWTGSLEELDYLINSVENDPLERP